MPKERESQQNGPSADTEQKIKRGRKIFAEAFVADKIPLEVLAREESKNRYSDLVEKIHKILEEDENHQAYQAIAENLILIDSLKKWVADLCREKNADKDSAAWEKLGFLLTPVIPKAKIPNPSSLFPSNKDQASVGMTNTKIKPR